MGEIDDHAWFFVLAEPTLKRFSQRIADDLPEDLAVLCSVGAPAPQACAIEGKLDGSVNARAGDQGSTTPTVTAQKFLSQVDFSPTSTYQISFSKNYRQQLLAVF